MHHFLVLGRVVLKYKYSGCWEKVKWYFLFLRFAFFKVLPGDYEIVATHPTWPLKEVSIYFQYVDGHASNVLIWGQMEWFSIPDMKLFYVFSRS